ncbi:UDP-galactopyranose mutase [Roseibium litorale]|uniref:NAD(P)-binding protein n=1 Tax=Roseibium litorale TaxID=2803841 RepID=A0ABR9CTS3_9HYPH|nr:UDP-galactopyranose mutase [Roseibium litorale]MBD8894270.1 NAD(P)-binding protein [Roseibium litorale]
MKRILIVGAGFAGASYARTLADSGYLVDVIDARSHIGGNAFDFVDENGLRRHRYGPHLFHTSNERVVTWLKRFGTWSEYRHKVRALTQDGNHVPLPINLDTLNLFFGLELGNEAEVEAYFSRISIANDAPGNAAEYLYARLGTELTDVFFRRYTKKMWDLDLEDMSPDVVKRIPIRYDRNDLYFPNDTFQLLPRDGYTAIFENILSHENIRVRLETPFEKSMEAEYVHVFNSMPIDEYFDFVDGELPYRSIRFHHRTDSRKVTHDWSVTNFTDTGPRTRETAWHLLPHHLVEDTGRYTYTSEEPCDYRDNNRERYYPVKTADGRFDAVYSRYKERAQKLDNVTFIGRCGTYQYLDMDQVINQSLMGCERWLALHG